MLSSCGLKSCVSWYKRLISILPYLLSIAQSPSHDLAGNFDKHSAINRNLDPTYEKEVKNKEQNTYSPKDPI